ncbi:hypothetical protein KY332_03235 [Candidatus Woesearchaeota archaeon]|nr:hypothetical protein [Candidatus Woesearchaeota archaeon]
MSSNLQLIEWKKKVILLDYADYELERRFNDGIISKKEKKGIKKILDQMWIEIWNYYPHSNPLLKERFHLNFS